MLSVSEALARVLSNFRTLEPELVTLERTVGRVLAEPIQATLDLPPFPNSSMDGYAVRAEDVRTASSDTPTTLAVVGDIPAGATPSLEITPGTAARIMTGAHMPGGADAVVPVEFTGMSREVMDGLTPPDIHVYRPVAAGAYVRPAGEDVRRGDLIMAPGQAVRTYDVGLLAAFGVSQIRVVRSPRVAVLSTGDELVDIHQTPGPGQIRDSNSYGLAALVRKYGGEPVLLGVARDDVEAVAAKLRAAAQLSVDLILSSAGVSVGAYDVVREAVEREGVLEFWKVRMRPGKPLAFGRFRSIPFFGLPGNPVSAVVGFELFVRPAILRMVGRTRLEKPALDVVLNETLFSDGRESYLRGVVTKDGDHYVGRSAGGQGSNILSALVSANALIVIPESVTEVRAGQALKAWMLDWSEEVF